MDPVKVPNQRTAKSCELFLRLLAFALTLVAAIIIGVDKQTKIVPIELVADLPPLNVPVTAKWHYLSAFVYFMVSNVIACSYAALSLLLLFTSRGENNNILELMIIVLDTVMVALLFSGNGAAAAVGLLGYRGNSHVQWRKVCNVFGKFCGQVGASLVVSLLGALAFILLLVFSALRLHKKSK